MKTLYDKVWESHIVHEEAGKPALMYVDLHLIHEVTSPQAFSEGLRAAGRKVRQPNRTFATVDHAIPTLNRNLPFKDPIAAQQVEKLRENCKEFGVKLYDLDRIEQGIIHVFGPEQGLTQPGMTIVCGDSHTSTHGAFGALAFGIGTSEVEHVLATQTLQQSPAKNFMIRVDGELPYGVTAKDIILGIINEIGTGGATGHVIEYAGSAIESLSIEGRMTVCNMSIEAGAKAGLIAPDEKTFEYLKGRQFAPKGEAWDRAVEYWRTLPTDAGATYDKTVVEIELPEHSNPTSPGARRLKCRSKSRNRCRISRMLGTRANARRTSGHLPTWALSRRKRSIRSRSMSRLSAHARIRGSKTFAKRPVCRPRLSRKRRRQGYDRSRLDADQKAG